MSVRARHIVVATAAQAAHRDRAAIAGGIASFDLMLRAGTATAAIVLRDFADNLSEGVAIFAGPGNNGGDAYVVAAQLIRSGIRVRMHAAEPPRTDDARRAAALVETQLVHGPPTGNERLAIDGLLGTGHRGPLRGPIENACDRLSRYQESGASIIALDVPSGLDATTGELAAGSVSADCTIAYGTYKRAHLNARDHFGRVLLVAIGLDGHVEQDDGAWLLAESGTLRDHVRPVVWNTWKTKRGVVGLVGGNESMAGSITIAARAALSTGAGLLHVAVAEQSRNILQSSFPESNSHSFVYFGDVVC
jgi:NAD(P)H-hydrate epimerase